MYSDIIVNPSVFKHATATSDGFNNLCTIIHQLATQGQYAGQVYLQGTLLGSFTLTSDPSVSATQVQIDVSTFDQLAQAQGNQSNPVPANPAYSVGQAGYVIFYASGPQNGFYVTLSTGAGTNATIVFDTRNLDNGDTLVFRPTSPGNYSVTNDKGNQQLAVVVQSYPPHQSPDPTTLNPVTCTLAQGGFNPANISLSPLQALVISIGIPASLSLSGPTSS